MSPESYIAAIAEFAGNYAPKGWMNCDGRLLNIRDYQPLYALLGTMYGGDGINNFAIPDLRPFSNDGQPDTGHHHRVDWASVGVPRRCICIEGLWPTRD